MFYGQMNHMVDIVQYFALELQFSIGEDIASPRWHISIAVIFIPCYILTFCFLHQIDHRGDDLEDIVKYLELEQQFSTKKNKVSESFRDRKNENYILNPKKAYNICKYILWSCYTITDIGFYEGRGLRWESSSGMLWKCEGYAILKKMQKIKRSEPFILCACIAERIH